GHQGCVLLGRHAEVRSDDWPGSRQRARAVGEQFRLGDLPDPPLLRLHHRRLQQRRPGRILRLGANTGTPVRASIDGRVKGSDIAAGWPAAISPHETLAAGLMDEARVAAAAGHRELARRRYESALYLLRSSAQASEASTILRSVGLLYFEDGEFGAG